VTSLTRRTRTRDWRHPPTARVSDGCVSSPLGCRGVFDSRGVLVYPCVGSDLRQCIQKHPVSRPIGLPRSKQRCVFKNALHCSPRDNGETDTVVLSWWLERGLSGSSSCIGPISASPSLASGPTYPISKQSSFSWTRAQQHPQTFCGLSPVRGSGEPMPHFLRSPRPSHGAHGLIVNGLTRWRQCDGI